MVQGLILRLSSRVLVSQSLFLMGCGIEEPPLPPPPQGISADNGDLDAKKSSDDNSKSVKKEPVLVNEATFRTTSEEKQSLTWQGKYAYFDKELSMNLRFNPKTAFFKQNERTFKQDSFVQNNSYQNRFALSRRDADLTDVRVIVDGTVLQPISAFTLDTYFYEVVFKMAPRLGAVIGIYYRPKDGLLSEFVLAGSVEPATVVVQIDGVVSTGFSFSSMTGKILFDAPPPDGASIRVDYAEALGANLQYDIAIPPTALKTLKVFNGSDPNRIYQVTYNGTQVVFNASDFKDGERFVVRYSNGSTDQTLNLPQPPIVGSIKFDLGSSACQESEFTILEDTIMTNCPIPEGSPIQVNYQYISAYHQNFSMANKAPTEVGNYLWRVFVGGEERTDFERSENVIKFSSALVPMTDVVVKIFRQ